MYTTSYEEVALADLLVRVQTLKHDGVRFVQMCAEKDSEDNIGLLYTFYDETVDAALNLVVPLSQGDEVPSIQELYFAAFSYENETHDLFGVRFVNMKLDFGGHFFNVENEAPMTIISPEQKAAREKAAKVRAAAAAKAAKAAAAKREAAEAKAAEAALTQSAEQADAEAVAKVAEHAGHPERAAQAPAPAAAAEAAPASEAPAAPALPAEFLAGLDERTAKMVVKMASMPPEKAAKLRENLAAKGIVVPEFPAPAPAKEAE